MAPPITAEQLSSIDDDWHRFELVEGRLRVMEPGGSPHSVSTGAVTRLLGNFVHERKLGMALGGKPGFITQRDPDTVRAPDFAFVAEARIPDPIPEWFPELVPDFAVEVVGKDDYLETVQNKAGWWLQQGVGEVWVVDPRRARGQCPPTWKGTPNSGRKRDSRGVRPARGLLLPCR
jgi:Uma2 family endonuclease